MPVRTGRIYRHAEFYLEPETGELKPKYFLVLATPARNDIVMRLLTSRYEGLRPEDPPCFHGDPYPGYFLGVLGGELGDKSWLDLRSTDDLDVWNLARQEAAEKIREIMTLPSRQFRSALECAASADDTTRGQEREIRNVLATIPAGD